VVNIGGVEKAQMLELAETASNAKLDAIAAVVPETVEATSEGLYRYFSPLGEVGLPLIVYWTPHVKNQKPTPELVASLMRIPTFAGTKDSSRDMESFAAICAGFGEDISVFQGVEMLHLPSLACGSAGVIGGGLNLYPGVLAALTQAFARHDLASARQLQQEASDNWSILNSRKSFRWICKRIWAEEGMITGTFCRESEDAPLSSPEMERIRGMVRL
jgi:4-hydroxy-tetrahydrodipicolinate synthase